jgi:hypothetical protein
LTLEDEVTLFVGNVVSRFSSDKVTWGRCSIVIERDIFRKMDWAWPPASPDPTPTDPPPPLWEHLREHVYLVWPRTVEDRLARLQADVTAVDDDVLVLRYF